MESLPSWISDLECFFFFGCLLTLFIHRSRLLKPARVRREEKEEIKQECGRKKETLHPRIFRVGGRQAEGYL